MEATDIIDLAIEKLKPIKYEPEYVGYFVKQDDMDMGGEDYCLKCINKAVKLAKQYYFEERQHVLDKYNEVEKTGFYKGIDVYAKYTKEQIEESKKRELEKYPEKVKFTYEGHDPDFSGGRTEPLTCEMCGKYFHTNFEADKEYSEYLLDEFGDGRYIKQSLKWKLDIAFYNYNYLEKEAQENLLQIASKITKVKLKH